MILPRRRLRIRKRQRGIALLDAMVASLVLVTALMGLANMALFAFNITTSTDNKGASYQLGRAAVEAIKQVGFEGVFDGTTTTYYNRGLGGANANQQSDSRFKVVQTLTTGPGTATYLQLKTLVTTVYYVPTGETLYSTTTYLTAGGI